METEQSPQLLVTRPGTRPSLNWAVTLSLQLTYGSWPRTATAPQPQEGQGLWEAGREKGTALWPPRLCTVPGL